MKTETNMQEFINNLEEALKIVREIKQQQIQIKNNICIKLNQ